MNNNTHKKINQKVCKCPVCGRNLQKSNQELFEILELDIQNIIEEGLTINDVETAFKQKKADLDSLQELQQIQDARSELINLIENQLDPQRLKKIRQSNKVVSPLIIDIHSTIQTINLVKCHNVYRNCYYCK